MSGAGAFCCALVLASHPALNATTTAAVVIAVRMDSIWPPENERPYHVHGVDLPDCARGSSSSARGFRSHQRQMARTGVSLALHGANACHRPTRTSGES